MKAHLQENLDRSAVSTEELKASNEELQAINEELRSAKEELETSKEELQSVNEELTTVNFELRMKVDEAGRNNDDLYVRMTDGRPPVAGCDAARYSRRKVRRSTFIEIAANPQSGPGRQPRTLPPHDTAAHDGDTQWGRHLSPQSTPRSRPTIRRSV